MSKYIAYLGPYVVCNNAPAKSQKEIDSCTATKCKFYKQETDEAFCPGCGKKINVISVPALVFPVTNKRKDEVETELATHEHTLGFIKVEGERYHHYWIYKSHFDEPVKVPYEFFETDPALETVENLTNLDRGEVLRKFSECHEKQLEVLRKAYGEGKVEIHWGLILRSN